MGLNPARYRLTLSQGARPPPACGICPQPRAGQEATQAMKILGHNHFSRLTVCVAAAARFQLSEQDARGIIDARLQAIHTRWRDVCDAAGLGEAKRNALWVGSSSIRSRCRTIRKPERFQHG